MILKIPSSVQSAYDQLSLQWNGNIRLRWMIRGIAYIIVFYLALSVREWRLDYVESLDQLLHRSARLDQLKGQAQWHERLLVEKVIGEKLQSKMWRAATANLAEADFQNGLRQLMSTHGVQGAHLRLAPTEELSVGGVKVFKVTAEVGGVVSVVQVDHLFKSFADYPKYIHVVRAGFGPQSGGQLSMLVTAYFLAREEGEVDAPAQ